MDLNLLKTFIKVADCGSLTKASKLLNQPKSKISRDLVKLENELEQSLLNRSPRGIVVTDSGHALLKSIRKKIDAIDSSINQFKEKSDQMKGVIKLTAPEDLSSYVLSRLITDFMELNPEIEIQLFSTNQFLDFKEHHIDLALRIGKLEDSSLIQKKVLDVEVALFGSKQYFKGHSQIEKMEDLNNHSVAIMTDIYGKAFDQKILGHTKPQFQSNSIPLLLNFIHQNRGIATVPSYLCQKEIKSNEFIRVLPNFSYSKRSLFMLSRPATFIPKHVKVLKEFLFETLQKDLN